MTYRLNIWLFLNQIENDRPAEFLVLNNFNAGWVDNHRKTHSKLNYTNTPISILEKLSFWD